MPSEEAKLVITPEALEQILVTVLEKAKEPPVDQKEVARRERLRQQMRELIRLQIENEKMRQANCRHLRENNTSRIAWMQKSDGVWRGVCQMCHKEFGPDINLEEFQTYIQIGTMTAQFQ